jgi:hypothetical protein
MAFIMCDDHNLSIEADGMDPTAAKRLMLGAEAKPDPTPLREADHRFRQDSSRFKTRT